MLAFLLGAGAGAAIAILARLVEASRLAIGPYAFYGNGALIVPALGSGLALYALWTWAGRTGRPRVELLWSVAGLHLGLGAALFALGSTSVAGLFFTGLLFVVPTAVVAFIALVLLERRLAAPRADHTASALVATAVVVAGMVLAAPFAPAGAGLITGAFTALARSAAAGAAAGLGALLAIVLLVSGLAVPLLLLR